MHSRKRLRGLEPEDEFMRVKALKGDIENFDIAPCDPDKPDDNLMSVDSDDVDIFDDAGDYSDGIASEDDGTTVDEEYDEGYISDDDPDPTKADCRVIRYTILKKEHIYNLQQEDITQVSSTLSIPRVSATILLRHYNWDVEKTHDAWFSDEKKVCKDVGLLEEQVEVRIPKTENAIVCPICLDEFPLDVMFAATCGHLFCNLCWTQYVSIKLGDGPECLKMRCPDPSCGVAVGQDIVNKLVSDEDKEKYARYLYRSYVEDKKDIKWCPGPGCEFAVKFALGSTIYDVVCTCRHSFCWNCIEDAHRPVDCDTVHNWVVKNNSESENVTWILANSKACPKCKKPIEKNKGCMHMTCSCGFHFCWLCLGDWSTHGESTGGFYACNVYEKAKAEGQYDQEEEKKQQAKEYLDKYAFYYERFAQNQKSRDKADESLQKMNAEYLKKLSDGYQLPETQLEFITNAWIQIIECRRVLKWTYAYGYYLPQSEHAKKLLFEYLQGQAESALERLHQCAEVELQTFLNDADAPKHFIPFRTTFRTKLLDLTKVTKRYFENLVCALENGLSDVNSHLQQYRLTDSEKEIRGRDMSGKKRRKGINNH